MASYEDRIPHLLQTEAEARSRMEKGTPEHAAFADPALPARGTFSHSAYQAYKICGKAYEFKYIHGAPWKSNPYTVRGSSVHKGVEQLLRDKIAGKLTPLAEGLETVSKDYDQRSLEIEDWLEFKPKELKDSVVGLYKIYHDAVSTMNPVAVEMPFAERVEGIPLTGYIDLVTKDPAIQTSGVTLSDTPMRHVVRDLKTSEKEWDENKVHKNTQLTLYSMITGVPYVSIDTLIARPVPEPKYNKDGSLSKRQAKGPELVSTASTRTARDTAVLMEDMHDVVDQIKKGNFPRTTIDNWSCGERCPYWKQCRGKKY